MSIQIRNFLQTQGLKLDIDAIRLAQITTQTVIEHGQACIENCVLYPNSQYIRHTPENELHLKHIFMALDSMFTQYPCQSAAVYALLPQNTLLLRLVAQGKLIENNIPVDDKHALKFLAARSALTGWLNIANNIKQWVKNNELAPDNQRSNAQMSIPITNDAGHIYGVVHLEHIHNQAFTEEIQAAWIGFTLAILPILQQFFPSQNHTSD